MKINHNQFKVVFFRNCWGAELKSQHEDNETKEVATKEINHSDTVKSLEVPILLDDQEL